MAVNITVALTDQEQALVQELADYYKPGATGAQITAWATKAAKNGLRNRIIQLQNQRAAEEANAARLAEQQATDADWPIADESA